MSTAAVSIIVATRNAARFLAQALDSIAAQDLGDYEVLVVDGGSTDDSLAIAGRYAKLRCLQQSGTGFINAWNTGMAASSTPFIAFLDSDDRWPADKLSSQLALLGQRPELDAVYGRVCFFLEPGCALPPGFRQQILEGSQPAPMSGSLLLRRNALARVGMLDEGMQLASDIAWIAKLRDHGAMELLDRVALCKRLHEGNLGHTTAWPLFRAELLELLRQRVAHARGEAE